ncbi:MAG: chorismate lyase [Proteobacteria bacterium]|nr:chorismate lyase [Pseudomonadota bacterium]
MGAGTDHAWSPLHPCGGRSSIAAWLAERGSLTARLRAHCDAFSLLRLYQGMARPRPDEARLLAQPLSQQPRPHRAGLRCGELG